MHSIHKHERKINLIICENVFKTSPKHLFDQFNYLTILNMGLSGTFDNGFVDQLMLSKWFPLLHVLKYKSQRSLCICGLTWAWQTWCKTSQMKIVECKWKNIYQNRSLQILPPMVPMTLQLKQLIFNLLIIAPTILENFLYRQMSHRTKKYFSPPNGSSTTIAKS